MKRWNGLEVYECVECGFSTVDAEYYDEHIKRTGHKDIPAIEESLPAIEESLPAIEESNEVNHAKSKK